MVTTGGQVQNDKSAVAGNKVHESSESEPNCKVLGYKTKTMS